MAFSQILVFCSGFLLAVKSNIVGAFTAAGARELGKLEAGSCWASGSLI